MGRPKGSVVRYREIAKQMWTAARRGAWPDLLPSYSELEFQFKASRLTIQRAVACLDKDGCIVRMSDLKWKVRGSNYIMSLYSHRIVLVLTTGLSYDSVRKGIEDTIANHTQCKQLQTLFKTYYFNKINTTMIAGLHEDVDVEGVLLYGIFSKQCQRDYSHLEKPVVLVDAPPAIDRLAAVCVANEAAAFDAVQRLAHLGHRRIAFCRRLQLKISQVDQDSIERQRGFLSGLKSCGISKGEDAIFSFTTRKNADGPALSALFSARPRYTAILAVDTFIAAAVAKAATAEGLILPRDLAIASFGESTSKWSGPRIDLERVGREAVLLLESKEIKQIRIPTSWHEGSTIDEAKK